MGIDVHSYKIGLPFTVLIVRVLSPTITLYSPEECDREVYAANLDDIDSLLQEALARYGISRDEFAQLGKRRQRAFLDDMPWLTAEMHRKRNWAKNADPQPEDSDLIAWGFLSVAVSYCDIVVTEKQKADLFLAASTRVQLFSVN